jgi:hypothetical protein
MPRHGLADAQTLKMKCMDWLSFITENAQTLKMKCLITENAQTLEKKCPDIETLGLTQKSWSIKG